MFSKTKSDILEETLLKHMDKVDLTFRQLVIALENIKEEIHNTNIQMSEHNSSQTLKLATTKSEILETVFSKVVDKHEYTIEKGIVFKEIEELNIRLEKNSESKVDKSTIKLLWVVITTIVGILTWILPL